MRPRSKQNRGLPPNLYCQGGYYKYRNPENGKWFGLGKPGLTNDKPPRIQRDSYVYISCNVPTLELEPDAVALCKEYNDLADSIQRGYKYNDNPMAYEVARIK